MKKHAVRMFVGIVGICAASAAKADYMWTGLGKTTDWASKNSDETADWGNWSETPGTAANYVFGGTDATYKDYCLGKDVTVTFADQYVVSPKDGLWIENVKDDAGLVTWTADNDDAGLCVTGTWVVGSSKAGGALKITRGKYSTTGRIHLSYGGDGCLNISGNGSLTAGTDMLVGIDTGGDGVLNVEGGTFLANSYFQVGVSGMGTVNQSGGDVTCNSYLSVGRKAGGTGTYNMTGGSFTSVNYPAIVAEEGTGTLDVSGTGVFNANKGLHVTHIATGADATVKVREGGKIITPFVFFGQGTPYLCVDGGTIEAYGSNAVINDFFNWYGDTRRVGRFDVGDGGMTLDVGNNTVTIDGADFGATKSDATITKTGSGTLMMDGLPVVGKLSVQEGSLIIQGNRAKPVLAHRWSFNGNLTDSVSGDVGPLTGTFVFTNDNTQVHLEGGTKGTSVVDLGANRLPSDNVTIEFWTTLRTQRTWCKMACIGASANDGISITFNKGSATGPTALELIGSGLSNVEGTGTLAVNVPYHIVLTLESNGRGGTRARMYARDLSTGAYLGHMDNNTDTWTVSQITQTAFYLGRSFWKDPDASATFDEVRVWDGVMSAEEIAASAMLGPDRLPGDAGNVFPSEPAEGLAANNFLLHRWNFNDNCKDLIGSNDAKFMGSTLPEYKDGRYVSLAGGARGTSWIDLGSNIVTGGDVPFTIEAWIKPREQRDWCQAFAFGSNAVSGIIFTLRRGSGTRVPSLNPVGSGQAGNIAIGETVLDANVEYHIAETVVPSGDGNSATICAYVFNATTGAKVGSLELEVTNWTTSKIEQDNFWLGHSWWNNWDTMADYNEVRVWSAALSEEQLAANTMYGPDIVPAITNASTLATRESLDCLDVAAGATVDLGGYALSQGKVSGSGTIQNGTLTVTDELSPSGDGTVGTLALSSDTVVTGTLRLDVGDIIEASGTLDLTQADVVVTNPEDIEGSMVIATSAKDGGILGPVKSLNIKGYSVRIAANGKSARITNNGLIILLR